MKSNLLRLALVSSLTLSLFHTEAVAESDWYSKCSAFGVLKPNENPSFQHTNCLLTQAALKADIPPEVVKAVATVENGGWKQFEADGKPVFNLEGDGGIGLMQITNDSRYNQESLKNDIIYNIEAGVAILSEKYSLPNLPKIKDAGRQVIENWYFPVMAYNGIKPVNSPIVHSTGEKNDIAYQEKVFALIEKDSFLDDTKLARFPFSISDFQYDPNSNQNIVFLKKEYVLTEPTHLSSYLFKTGDKVFVTEEGARVRLQPGLPRNGFTLAENTTLTITGDSEFDLSHDSYNQYVWWPVQTEDGRKGYMSSAYIAQQVDVSDPTKTDTVRPTIIGVEDKDINVGEAFDPLVGVTANDHVDGDITSKIQITGQVVSKKTGVYTLTYKVSDAAGNVAIQTRLISVIDAKAPEIKGTSSYKINIDSVFNLRTGLTAKDNVDGDLTKAIKVSSSNLNTKKPGVYKVTYSVTDSSGNIAKFNRTITVIDHIAPKIFGATSKTIKLNAKFNPMTGIKATDNVDGNVTSKVKVVSGKVNSKKKGRYKLTYAVTDKAGKKAVVSRIITVK